MPDTPNHSHNSLHSSRTTARSAVAAHDGPNFVVCLRSSGQALLYPRQMGQLGSDLFDSHRTRGLRMVLQREKVPVSGDRTGGECPAEAFRAEL
jgi:hypothetical protein